VLGGEEQGQVAGEADCELEGSAVAQQFEEEGGGWIVAVDGVALEVELLELRRHAFSQFSEVSV
jgi:hypothetical protein